MAKKKIRKRGPSRACSVCGVRGHNKRSHVKGSTAAKRLRAKKRDA